MTIAACVMLPFGYAIFQEQLTPHKLVVDASADSLIEIRGFNYEAKEHGSSVFQITADRLLVKKQKFGHFSIGDFCDAKLDNAFIRLYEADTVPVSHAIGSALHNLRASFASSGRILSVSLSPIRIEVIRPRSVTTSIDALSAEIRPYKKDILFGGNVTIVSGPKALNTAQLRLCLKTETIQTVHPFLLKTQEGRRQGNRFTSDLYLTPLDASDASFVPVSPDT